MYRSLGINEAFTHCCLYSFVGFFFSLITPSATGGQPVQLYVMKKDGLPLTVSAMLLVIATINYKLVLVAIGAFVFIVCPGMVWHYIKPVLGWCISGMVLILPIYIMFVFVSCLAFSVVAYLNIIYKRGIR